MVIELFPKTQIQGNRVILTIQEYERLKSMELIAEFFTATDKDFNKEGCKEDFPEEIIEGVIKGRNALKLWREHKGYTLANLSKELNISQKILKDLEKEKQGKKIKALKAVANHFCIQVSDII